MNPSFFQEDDERAVRHFTALLAENGVDARSLDWGSRASQTLRFRVLAQVANLQGATVLDVGCGLGDLFDWLNSQRTVVDYTGIDITPDMVDAASHRFPKGKFHVNNLLQENGELARSYDFVLASGIFYFRQVKTYDFLQEMVTAMFKRCSRAVAFNSLSSWAPGQDANEFYADPAQVLAICKELSPWVVLRHDYHARDLTVYMYREKPLA